MLRTLTLLRHGEAEPSAASGRDFDRALTAKGTADARATAAALADAGFSTDVALVSTARRAQATWEVAAGALAGVEHRAMRSLYNASATTLYEAAQAAGASSVIVVAHNPGLAEAVAGLGGAEVLGDGFPPASAAVFERGGAHAPWRLVRFITPEDS